MNQINLKSFRIHRVINFESWRMWKKCVNSLCFTILVIFLKQFKANWCFEKRTNINWFLIDYECKDVMLENLNLFSAFIRAHLPCVQGRVEAFYFLNLTKIWLFSLLQIMFVNLVAVNYTIAHFIWMREVTICMSVLCKYIIFQFFFFTIFNLVHVWN